MRITTLLPLALAGALAFICIRIVGQPDPAPATIKPLSPSITEDPPITEEAETSVAHPSLSATERSLAQQLDKSFQLAVRGAPDGDWVQVLSSGDPGVVHLESARVHGGMISIRNRPSSMLAAISGTVGVGWTTRSPDGSVDRLVFSDRSSIRVTNPDEAVRGDLFQASAVGANERQAVRDSATCRRIWSLAAEDGATHQMAVGRDFLRRLGARDPAIHRALSVERPRAGGEDEDAGLVATCLPPGPYQLVTSSRSGWVFTEPSGHAASIGGDSSGLLSLDGSELQPPPLTTVVSLEGGQEASVSVRRRGQASIHGNLDDLGPMDSAHVTLSRFVIRNASKKSSGIATYKVLESATLQRGEAYAFRDLDLGV